MTRIIGWDLGGANLKLALVEAMRVTRVAQVCCPVTQDRGKFDAALEVALRLVPLPALHAVTMTGELSDVFADRREGVAYLVSLMQRVTAGQRLLIYAGRAGFLDANTARCHWQDVASANWHASTALAARHCGDGLLVDVGTTTIDLIPLRGGQPAARGYSDAERLTEGELVYAGVVRTPVMAIAQEAPFGGRRQRIAAERFATMADVYRLTGDLPEDADTYPTPDLKDKSPQASAARLARMLGRDAHEAPQDAWVEVARHFADCQRTTLEENARRLLTREAIAAGAAVIGAGCGRFLARRLAERLGRPYADFAELIDTDVSAREMAARCAPAIAVALPAGAERTCGSFPC
jgi:probable H4MPT-linked C1 transfer pathway protein